MRIIRTFLIVLGISMMSLNTFAQEDLKSVYQASYQMALRYNDRAEAKSDLYKLLALEPQNDSLRTTLAYLYFEARQYASNVLICMDVLAQNPQNTGALEMASASYENLGLKDKALENLEKLYVITDDFQTLYRMAFIQYDLEKFHQCDTNVDILMQAPEAEEATVFYTIEEEEKEFPIKVALMNLKGLVNQELGNDDIARQNFENALKIAPEFNLAKENLDKMSN